MKVPALLPEFANDGGAQAARRLFVVCAEKSDASILPVVEFLVSLYDSRYTRLDTYMLCRRISGQCFEDVLTVMRWFRSTENGFDIHHIVGVEAGGLLVCNLRTKLCVARNGEY
ncbi:Uncharacterised protein [Burkholderia pseudomallei]|nr:Uncharacterised protein [Burkholderia pseudomallei]